MQPRLPSSLSLLRHYVSFLSLRFGAVGNDVPKHVFRCEVGIAQSDNKANAAASSSSSSRKRDKGGKRYIVGDGPLRHHKQDYVDILNPFDCSSNSYDSGKNQSHINWDAVEEIITYGVESSMRVSPAEYPFLFCESHFNTPAAKATLLELSFESFDTPAVYVASNATLAAFSAGKTTATVVDFGASEISVTPVVDGYAVAGARLSTSRGGNWLDEQIRYEIEDNLQHIAPSVLPWFLLKGGKNYSGMCRKSFVEMHTHDVYRDIKHLMCFVPHKPMVNDHSARAKIIADLGIPPYMLPDGTELSHSDGLSTAPEKLFVANRKRNFQSVSQGLPARMQNVDIDCENDSLQDIFHSTMLLSDADSRRDLLSAVITTGGGSLTDGFSQRLLFELHSSLIPAAYKVRGSHDTTLVH